MTNDIYTRITVVLSREEFRELNKIAQRELRRPRDQAAYILRRVLFGEPIQTTNTTQPILDGDPQNDERAEDS